MTMVWRRQVDVHAWACSARRDGRRASPGETVRALGARMRDAPHTELLRWPEGAASSDVGGVALASDLHCTIGMMSLGSSECRSILATQTCFLWHTNACACLPSLRH